MATYCDICGLPHEACSGPARHDPVLVEKVTGRIDQLVARNNLRLKRGQAAMQRRRAKR